MRTDVEIIEAAYGSEAAKVFAVLVDGFVSGDEGAAIRRFREGMWILRRARDAALAAVGKTH